MNKNQAAFYKKVGRREGKLDCLASDNYTVAQRAERTCYRMGIYCYVKYFIAGYIETAMEGRGS